MIRKLIDKLSKRKQKIEPTPWTPGGVCSRADIDNYDVLEWAQENRRKFDTADLSYDWKAAINGVTIKLEKTKDSRGKLLKDHEIHLAAGDTICYSLDKKETDFRHFKLMEKSYLGSGTWRLRTKNKLIETDFILRFG